MAIHPVAVQEKLVLRPVQQELGLAAEYVVETGGLKLGRHSTNDIVLPSKSVSRFHAKIVYDDGDFVLNDLQSSNGTHVNGERILQKVLKPGMRIKLGDVGFLCEQQAGQAFEEASQAGETDSLVSLLSIPEHKTVYQKTIKPESTDEFTRRRAPDNLEGLRRANQQLKILYRLAEELSPINTEEHMLNSALDLVFEAVPVDQGVIMLRDSLDGELRSRISKNRSGEGQESPLKISRSVVDRCLNEQVAILIRDTAAEENFDPSVSIIQNRIRSIICAPLMGTRSVMGILLIDTRHLVHSYNDDDLAFISNIAQELALALEVRAQREELLRNSQMVAIGETIMNIAHGIKNILQVSDAGRSMVEGALEQGKLEDARHYWTTLGRSLNRINTLVCDMLDYSREWKPQLEQVSLNKLMTEICEASRPNLQQKGIELIVQPDDEVNSVSVDVEALRQSLENLLVNAADAIESESGRIKVLTRHLSSGDCQLIVSDNGCGIAPEHLESIFIPHFSTKGERGNGLGLASAKKQLNGMGGDIQAESTLDEGSTFTITVPSRATLRSH